MPAFAVRAGITNSHILNSWLGLLCLGKNDFDAIEAQRADAFFTRTLHLSAVPSSPTLRQRLDTHASNWFELVKRINAAVLSVKIADKPINFVLLPCGYLPLDVDILRYCLQRHGSGVCGTLKLRSRIQVCLWRASTTCPHGMPCAPLLWPTATGLWNSNFSPKMPRSGAESSSVHGAHLLAAGAAAHAMAVYAASPAIAVMNVPHEASTNASLAGQIFSVAMLVRS